MKKVKKIIKGLLNKLPHVRTLKRQVDLLHVVPGHYYSPINNPEELLEDQDRIWGEKRKKIAGVDMHEDAQLELLEKFSSYYPESPFSFRPNKALRFFYNNGFYGESDGLFLYSMMRHFKPKRIVEVGSGFSSALMLDVNGLFFKNEIHCTFIDPNPERLHRLLREEDHASIFEERVQDVKLSVFESLESDDILFIDSSHVSKVGSDLNYLIFEVLPLLKKGVKVHFHDIFFPFEYPKSWVIDKHISWNEIYVLRALLMNSARYKVLICNTFLQQFHEPWFKEKMPACLDNQGGSLWLEISE